MVYVKLLKDVAEGGIAWAADMPRDATGQRPQLKTVRAKNPDFVSGGEAPEYIVTEYREGAIVTMHEASAEKWISRGLCEVVTG